MDHDELKTSEHNNDTEKLDEEANTHGYRNIEEQNVRHKQDQRKVLFC